MSKIALIGEKDIIKPLAFSGVKVFPVDSETKFSAAVEEISQDKEYSMAFVLESVAEANVDVMAKAEAGGISLICIPDFRKVKGFFRENLRELTKKATGAL
ncbi:MAG: V-type ATP synthase subunit F [Candidatus Margulisiibacteriota bacterium]